MLVFVDAVLKRLVVVIAKPVCHYDREGELLHQITITMVIYNKRICFRRHKSKRRNLITDSVLTFQNRSGQRNHRMLILPLYQQRFVMWLQWMVDPQQ